MSDKSQSKHEKPAGKLDGAKDNKSCETVHLSPDELRKISGGLGSIAPGPPPGTTKTTTGSK